MQFFVHTVLKFNSWCTSKEQERDRGITGLRSLVDMKCLQLWKCETHQGSTSLGSACFGLALSAYFAQRHQEVHHEVLSQVLTRFSNRFRRTWASACSIRQEFRFVRPLSYDEVPSVSEEAALRDCCKPLAVLGAGASAAKLCSTCYPSAKQSLLSWTPLIHLKGRCGCTTSLSLRYMVVKLQSIVSCMTVSHFLRLVIQRIHAVEEHILVGLQLARLSTALAQLQITWHVFDMSG